MGVLLISNNMNKAGSRSPEPLFLVNNLLHRLGAQTFGSAVKCFKRLNCFIKNKRARISDTFHTLSLAWLDRAARIDYKRLAARGSGTVQIAKLFGC